MKIGCVVLASGTSSRFGANKLLMDLKGRALFDWILQSLPRDIFEQIVVVTPYEQIEARARDLDMWTVHNPDPEIGPGLTTRLGLEALLALDLDACLFCVSDQPYLNSDSIRGLISTFRGGIRALGWEGTKGNPVLFAKEFFPALLDLPDNKGGSYVIRDHPEALSLYDAQCALELRDADTPRAFADLAAVNNFFLTGPRGAGKSTILRSCLEWHNQKPTGFRTLSYDVAGHHAGHYMHALSPLIDKELNDKPISVYAPPGCIAIPKVFDRFGTQYLRQSLHDEHLIILMDELGTMERDVQEFHDTVFDILDGFKPVIGVLRDAKDPWLDRIRSRLDTLVMRVEEDTRVTVSDRLSFLLASVTL